MEKSDSQAILVLNDELENIDSEDVGFSSGYDSSSDPSEISPEVNQETSAKGLSNPEPVSKCENTIKYCSTTALCDHLKYILSMPELCDVTFLVGPAKVPVHGVKAILGTRSRVMYQLILQKQKEEEQKKLRKSRNPSRLIIDVKKYEPEDFRRIVQFIHCGTVDVTVKNVTGLLCGASQFKLLDLKVACWDFIKRCLDSENDSVSAIKKSACQYSHLKAANKLLYKISKYLEHQSRERTDKALSSSSSSTRSLETSSSFASPSVVSTTV